MILSLARLRHYPRVFLALTGLTISEFEQLVSDLLPRFQAALRQERTRQGRRRAIGAGHPFELDARDQLLLTVVWLRRYPVYEVLGFLFGVSDSTVTRYIARVLLLLEAAGRDTMRLPDPGRSHHRQLDELLAETPEVAVIIDTFEQRIQRPQDRQQADTYYSGKKKQHTLKSQLAVDEDTGQIVDVAASVRGPVADLQLLKDSQLLDRLPADVGGMGDLAYVGIATYHPQGLGATPRRKPRGQPRPPEDVAYNTAFARRRVTVEHAILRVRRYDALTVMDRHHRCLHTERVAACAGLANRQISARLLA